MHVLTYMMLIHHCRALKVLWLCSSTSGKLPHFSIQQKSYDAYMSKLGQVAAHSA